MQQRTLWAERVPHAPFPMRIADLTRLSDDGYTYEIVEGELLRMPGSGVEASRIAARLLIALGSYVEAHGVGDVLGADGTYDLTQPGDTVETAL
ncbi:MAG: Uma2 family endonuclease, partial [Ktedonobacterales bacterium]